MPDSLTPDVPNIDHVAKFYTFSIVGLNGVIKAYDRVFDIRRYFPNLEPEGQLILAILAYSGFFNGFFYNLDTHEMEQSDIFNYFAKLQQDLDLDGIHSGKDLVDFIFNSEKKLKLENFLLTDSKHLSQVFSLIRGSLQTDGQDIDIFQQINSRLLDQNSGAWQGLFEFWKEYIDIKKKFFNFCEFKFRKIFELTQHNFFVADYTKKQPRDNQTLGTLLTSTLFKRRIELINLKIQAARTDAFKFLKNKVDHWLENLNISLEEEAIDKIIRHEVRSGVGFLQSNGIVGRAWRGDRLKSGKWVAPSNHQSSGLKVNGSHVSLNLIQQESSNFNGDWIYYSTGYGNIISSCPVRTYSLTLGSLEQ